MYHVNKARLIEAVGVIEVLLNGDGLLGDDDASQRLHNVLSQCATP